MIRTHMQASGATQVPCSEHTTSFFPSRSGSTQADGAHGCRYTANYLYSCAPTDPTDPWGTVLPAGCTPPDVVRPLQGPCILAQHSSALTSFCCIPSCLPSVAGATECWPLSAELG